MSTATSELNKVIDQKKKIEEQSLTAVHTVNTAHTTSPLTATPHTANTLSHPDYFTFKTTPHVKFFGDVSNNAESLYEALAENNALQTLTIEELESLQESWGTCV